MNYQKNKVKYEVTTHNNSNDDELVGFSFTENKLKVVFPRGLKTLEAFKTDKQTNVNPDNENTGFVKEDEEQGGYQQFKTNLGNIQLLYKVLRKISKEEGNSDELGNIDKNFPFQAMETIVRYFVKFGEYKEIEKTHKKRNFGKINWNKTIKRIEARLTSNTIFYENFIVSKKNIFEDIDFIKVFDYSVNYSFKRLGRIKGYSYEHKVPERLIETIENNKKFYINLLERKLKDTYNVERIDLIKAIIGLLKTGIKDNTPSNFGTFSFHTVWEKMIDEVYGNEDKKEFYPKTQYVIQGIRQAPNFPLEPDTVNITNKRLTIIDAKYYGYCPDNNTAKLPQSSDIFKQILYGQWAYENRKKISEAIEQSYCKEDILNMFLLPGHLVPETSKHLLTDNSTNPLNNELCCSETEFTKYIGYAEQTPSTSQDNDVQLNSSQNTQETDPEEHQNNKQMHEKVHVFQIDTKTTMKQYVNSENLTNIDNFREIIEKRATLLQTNPRIQVSDKKMTKHEFN